MKKIITGILGIFMFSIIIMAKIEDKKVLVNHNGKVISISVNAVSKHLGHGDTIVSNGIGNDTGL